MLDCKKCEERRRLIVEAFAARRAGDTETYWKRLQEVAISLKWDVKALAKALAPKYLSE